jgi:hypothetical protein
MTLLAGLVQPLFCLMAIGNTFSSEVSNQRDAISLIKRHTSTPSEPVTDGCLGNWNSFSHFSKLMSEAFKPVPYFRSLGVHMSL